MKRFTTERCGKSCMEEYCATHRPLIGGRPIPVPCQGCGISTWSETGLCRKCGQHIATNRLRRKEARTRKQCSLVIDEVEAGNFRLKWCWPVDICTEVPRHTKECHGVSSRRPPNRSGGKAHSSSSDVPLSCSRRTTLKPRKRRLANTKVSDAEMDAYIEELLAEIPKRRKPRYPSRLPPPPPLRWDHKQACSFHLRTWRMRVPQGHPSERDLTSFLNSAQTHIERKLTDEVLDLCGLKF